MEYSAAIAENPNRVGENAHLRRAFATAASLCACGEAIAQRRSNHVMGEAFMAKEKILVVDDEPMIRYTLNEALRGWEYDTIEASTVAGSPNPALLGFVPKKGLKILDRSSSVMPLPLSSTSSRKEATRLRLFVRLTVPALL
jgi:hypothetical protein